MEACREALRGGQEKFMPKRYGPQNFIHQLPSLIGINMFDTSPYYGRSEYILGDALKEISDEFPRSTYYLQTKVGRYGYTTKEFDYTGKRIRESVLESMKRMHTDYIDAVLCHDVEFVDFEKVVGDGYALQELFKLKVRPEEQIFPERGLIVRVGREKDKVRWMLRLPATCTLENRRIPVQERPTFGCRSVLLPLHFAKHKVG